LNVTYFGLGFFFSFSFNLGFSISFGFRDVSDSYIDIGFIFGKIFSGSHF
jgi:hypothetical protein